jgi:transcriptional regulator with XRE-family HTH domain
MSGRRTKHPARPELQARRRLVGLSQERFAEAIEASPTAVKSWEQGWSTPMPRYRPAMAEVLGVSFVELGYLLDPSAAPALNGHEVPAWTSHYESLVLAAGGLAEAAQPTSRRCSKQGRMPPLSSATGRLRSTTSRSSNASMRGSHGPACSTVNHRSCSSVSSPSTFSRTPLVVPV